MQCRSASLHCIFKASSNTFLGKRAAFRSIRSNGTKINPALRMTKAAAGNGTQDEIDVPVRDYEQAYLASRQISLTKDTAVLTHMEGDERLPTFPSMLFAGELTFLAQALAFSICVISYLGLERKLIFRYDIGQRRFASPSQAHFWWMTSSTGWRLDCSHMVSMEKIL